MILPDARTPTLNALPAAAVKALPCSDHSSGQIFNVEGREIDPNLPLHATYQVASPEYVTVARVPLREGAS